MHPLFHPSYVGVYLLPCQPTKWQPISDHYKSGGIRSAYISDVQLTAIPDTPLSRRLGSRAGKTDGSV